MIQQVSPTELQEKIQSGKKPFLLDVREEFERDICKLTDDKHIPMKEIPMRYSELDSSSEIVVYCRSGQRSMNVCNFLAQAGFEKISNLAGGILAWSDQIDPSLPKY